MPRRRTASDRVSPSTTIDTQRNSQQFRGRCLRSQRRPTARMTGQRRCRFVSKRSTLPDHYTKLSIDSLPVTT